jgi:tetratricopeptide (TPR) repeat protein
MGRVYLARHRELGTPVALKALALTDERLLASFQGEIEASARLDHPHIARVFAHGRAPGGGPLTEGTPWFAMELLRSDLATELRGVSSWDQVAPLLGHLFDALAHAHARGIVHRDLKPSNVLFGRPDDLRPGLKLVDFGIAARGRDSVRGVGTPSAMAPEQWEDDLGAVGPWTDLYALGVLVWRVVCGRKPIEGDDLPGLLYRQGRADFDPFAPRLEVPEGLEDWLRTCMAPRAAQRFQAVADARHALEELLDGPLVPASADAEDVTEPLDQAATVSLEQLDAQAAGEVIGQAVVPGPVPVAWGDPLPEPAPVHLAGVGLSLLRWREPRLVGRSDLRAVLWGGLVKAVQRGRAVAVELEGAAGVGVSALGRWLVERARERSGALAVHVSGRPGAAPNEGVHNVVDELLQPMGTPGALPGRQRGLERLGAHHARTLEALEALDRPGEDAVRAAARVVLGIARRRPVVLFLDDAQHDPSLQGLAALAAGLRAPVLVVVRGAQPGPRALRARVGPLGPSEASLLLGQLLPLDIDLERALVDRTGGRPAELRRWVERVRDDLQLGPRGFRLRSPLPPPVSAPLDALTDFDDDDLRLLEVAALLGRDVPRSLWIRAAGVPPSRCDLLARRVVARGLARNQAGLVLEPELAAALRQRAESAGRAEAHHHAAARSMEALGGAPLPTGRAWLAAGRVERGVRRWLDGADAIVRAEGPRALAGVLEEARRRLAPLEESEALHGRCEVLRLQLAHEARDRDVGARAADLETWVASRGWHDAALYVRRLLALSAPVGGKHEVYEEGMARYGEQASDTARARLLLSWYVVRERFAAADRDTLYATARATLDRALVTGDGLEHGYVSRPQLQRMRYLVDAIRLGREQRHREVIKLLRQATEISRRHSALTLSSDLLDLGSAYAAAGDPGRAEACYREAGRWGAWLGIVADEAMAVTNRAGLAVMEGQFGRGAELAQRALPGTRHGYLSAVLQLFVWVPRVQAGRFDAEALENIASQLVLLSPPDPEVVKASEALAEAASVRNLPLPPSFELLLELTRGRR